MKNTLKICASLCFLLTIFLFAPLKAAACACCAEPGTWFQRTVKNDAVLRDIKNELLNNLFSNAAGFGKGIAPEPASEIFKLKLQTPRNLATWLAFADERGNAGKLMFNGNQMNTPTIFAADLREAIETNPTVTLYKELRYEGIVTGDGIFARGLAPAARYRLIFQGRGNMCHNASDFKTWILQVNGAKADFAFYGSFTTQNEGERSAKVK
jgi:hypothetical protein